MKDLEQSFDLVAAYFGIMSEPMRLKILHTICEKEKTVSEIVEELDATQANVSRHLGLMHRAGVVGRRKQGNQVFYRIADAAMLDICRAVCARIAGHLDERAPLRRRLLKLIPAPTGKGA